MTYVSENKTKKNIIKFTQNTSLQNFLKNNKVYKNYTFQKNAFLFKQRYIVIYYNYYMVSLALIIRNPPLLL